jgi:cell wall-associated NlpC family hydrolase
VPVHASIATGDVQSTPLFHSFRARILKISAVGLASSALVAGALVAPAMGAPAASRHPAAVSTVRKASHPTSVHQIAHPTAGLQIYVARRRAQLAAERKAKLGKVAHVRAIQAAQRRGFMAKLLVEASKFRGAPYVFGAVGPGAFDCSGFTRYVFGQMGIALPHTSFGQYAMTRHIPASQVQPGDLLFLNGLGHVAIYAGDGLMWDASRPGGSVQLRAPYGPFLVGRVHV